MKTLLTSAALAALTLAAPAQARDWVFSGQAITFAPGVILEQLPDHLKPHASESTGTMYPWEMATAPEGLSVWIGPHCSRVLRDYGVVTPLRVEQCGTEVFLVNMGRADISTVMPGDVWVLPSRLGDPAVVQVNFAGLPVPTTTEKRLTDATRNLAEVQTPLEIDVFMNLINQLIESEEFGDKFKFAILGMVDLDLKELRAQLIGQAGYAQLVDSIDSWRSSVNGQLDELRERIAVLETKVEELQSDVGENTSAIAEMRTQIDGITAIDGPIMTAINNAIVARVPQGAPQPSAEDVLAQMLPLLGIPTEEGVTPAQSFQDYINARVAGTTPDASPAQPTVVAPDVHVFITNVVNALTAKDGTGEASQLDQLIRDHFGDTIDAAVQAAADLQAKIDEANAANSTLTGTVEEANGVNTTLAATVTAAGEADESLAGTVGQATEAEGTLTKLVETAKGQIDELEALLATREGTEEADTSEVEALRDQLVDLKSLVEGLTSDLEAHEGAENDNGSTITDLRTQLTTLKGAVDVLKEQSSCGQTCCTNCAPTTGDTGWGNVPGTSVPWGALLTGLLGLMAVLAFIAWMRRDPKQAGPVVDQDARDRVSRVEGELGAFKQMLPTLGGAAAGVAATQDLSGLVTKKDLDAVSARVDDLSGANESTHKLAAAAMQTARVSLDLGLPADWTLIGDLPSQKDVDDLKPEDDPIALRFTHPDRGDRTVTFAKREGVLDNGQGGMKAGLEVQGIATVTKPIAVRVSNMVGKVRNGIKGNHLVGVDENGKTKAMS